MPLWTGDYLKKTRHLSTLEHGAYLLLIMECWERPSGSIPNKPELLARLAGVTIQEWNGISPIVLEFFKLNKRKKEYTQVRVTEELSKMRQKRVSAQQSIAKRWNKKKKDDTNVLPTKNERNTNHTHTHNQEEKIKTKAKKATSLKQNWVLPEDYRQWVKDEGLTEDNDFISLESQKFKDYWLGDGGTKKCWFATWRNHCRKDWIKWPKNGKSESSDNVENLLFGDEDGQEATI